MFFSSAREIFLPEISFCAEKISLTGCFCLEFARISTFADVEKRKAGVFFHLTTDGTISKRGRFYPNISTRTKKHKAITEKPKDKIKKQTYYTEKTKHKQAKQIVFLSLPHSIQKYKPTFSPNVPTFRDFLPSFSQNLPTPHQLPFNPTRRTRAYAYVRARALSEFAIFAFTLHLTAQQSVYQSIECEGKPCTHLHLHRNNLKFNTLHDIYCKKSVKVKG